MTIHESVLDISLQLRDRCRYSRLQGNTGAVLFIHADYFIERECQRAFAELGWRVMALPLEPSDTFISRMLNAVLDGKPDLFFTVNHLGFDRQGSLTALLEAIELPHVSWFVDSPAYILLHHTEVASPLALTPVWERSWEPFLREFGFENVFHLPLAADLSGGRKGAWRANYRHRIAFVGDSMVEAVAKYFWRGRMPKFPGVEMLTVLAARRFSETNDRDPWDMVTTTAEQLDVSLPALSPEARLALETTVVLEATRLQRSRMATALASAGLELFGDDGWRSYAPPGVILHPHVDYYTELPAIYRQTAVNLNVTSLQMPTAVNQRVFDAPAAGGFLMTDKREDLDLLFDRDEVVTYREPEELPQIADYWLAHDDERRLVTERAAARIAAEHTYRLRIAAIITNARRVFAGARNPKAVAV